MVAAPMKMLVLHNDLDGRGVYQDQFGAAASKIERQDKALRLREPLRMPLAERNASACSERITVSDAGGLPDFLQEVSSIPGAADHSRRRQHEGSHVMTM